MEEKISTRYRELMAIAAEELIVKKEVVVVPDQRPLECFIYTGKNSEKSGNTYLVLSGQHGNEPEGTYLIEKYLKPFVEKNIKACFSDKQIIFVPRLNVYGIEKYIQVIKETGEDPKPGSDKMYVCRKNANGVDLNTNFPTNNFEPRYDRQGRCYTGEIAGSERETKFLMEILNAYHPNFILSLHARMTEKQEPLNNFDGGIVAQHIAQQMEERSGYKAKGFVEREWDEGIPGSLGNYASRKLKIPMITLELKKSFIMPFEDRIDLLWEDQKEALLYCLKMDVQAMTQELAPKPIKDYDLYEMEEKNNLGVFAENNRSGK